MSAYPPQKPWDGSGTYEDGETEDYLLAVGDTVEIEEGEWGDAPEGVLAYPSSGIFGSFPTCACVGPSGHIFHMPLCWAGFGPGIVERWI